MKVPPRGLPYASTLRRTAYVQIAAQGVENAPIGLTTRSSRCRGSWWPSTWRPCGRRSTCRRRMLPEDSLRTVLKLRSHAAVPPWELPSERSLCRASRPRSRSRQTTPPRSGRTKILQSVLPHTHGAGGVSFRVSGCRRRGFGVRMPTALALHLLLLLRPGSSVMDLPCLVARASRHADGAGSTPCRRWTSSERS